MSPWLPYLGGGGGDRSPICVSIAYRKIINRTLKRYRSSKPYVEVLLINGESKLKNHSNGSVLRLFCAQSNDRGTSSR